MKRTISFFLCFLILFSLISTVSCKKNEDDVDVTTTATPTKAMTADFSKTAMEFVDGMTVGWNLGNTLDSCYSWGNIPKDNPTPEQVETGWQNPVTTQKMISYVSQSGFNAIRIPITWYLFISENNGKYAIDDAWLKRVKEIVDYAYKYDMYVIINMHHDDGDWLDISKTSDEWVTVKNKYKAIWQIIADYFKDYNEKLVFEGANEIIYQQGDQKDWWGQELDYFLKQNELYQIFVDTVRASGGYNDKRYLMLPTYGAQWYNHQYSKLEIPNDDDRVIIDIHWYSSTTNTEEPEKYFSAINKFFVQKNIPVVIGECGVRKNARTQNKVNWTQAYIKTAYKYDLKCFLWDDGGDFAVLDRNNVEWIDFNYIDALFENAS